ncbi:hypothetical protein ACH5RR_019207 [Cinchona calisaya]|uniref:Uncharacterized protein n=1 Tax=Cinchona calisaya TaxID=153742 RepID=A0ABD2ZTX2_9GENT
MACYLAVRQRRLLLAAKLQSDERSITEVDDETASETSSSFSGMSAYTAGTRRGSAASISSTSTKGSGRQRNKGKICAGSLADSHLYKHFLVGRWLWLNI